jgi:hypothetical protein
MAFMRADISTNVETWCFIDGDSFEVRTILPDGDYYALDQSDFIQIAEDNNLDPEDVQEAYNAILKDTNNADFTITTGYRGWLYAPGYLDRTDPVICATQAEAAQALLGMYFDHAPEYMDDGELEDALWLAEVAGNEKAMTEFESEQMRRSEVEVTY